MWSLFRPIGCEEQNEDIALSPLFNELGQFDEYMLQLGAIRGNHV